MDKRGAFLKILDLIDTTVVNTFLLLKCTKAQTWMKSSDKHEEEGILFQTNHFMNIFTAKDMLTFLRQHISSVL